MKVAITVDHLLARESVHPIVEKCLEVFEDAPIFTIAHRPKAILGPIEMRPIRSSFLSRLMQSPSDFSRYQALLPGAVKQVPISCSYDLIINISSGLSQGLPKCEQTKQLTYLVNDLSLQGKGLRYHLFKTYCRSFAKKSLAQADKIWVSSDELASRFDLLEGQYELVPALLNLAELPLFPTGMRQAFAFRDLFVNAPSFGEKSARGLVDQLTSCQAPFVFIGEDAHLGPLKSELGDDKFLGNRCLGEFAPLMAQAKALVHGVESCDATPVFESMALGRPVISLGDFDGQSLVNKEGLIRVALDAIGNCLTQSDLFTKDEGDIKSMRAQVQGMHDLKFKGKIMRLKSKGLNDYFGP